MSSNDFLEIEHKFVVGAEFDHVRFFKAVEALSPSRQSRLTVRDTYYVLGHDAKHVFRHRFDKEIQQLTVKSVEADAAVRTEINLPIDQSTGDQSAPVKAFMKALGASWSADLVKDIQVAYFQDCEIVYYRASSGSEFVNCIEFEAIDSKTVQEGLGVLTRYEELLGFDPKHRDGRSLFELLLVKSAPPEIRRMFNFI
jgi:hypothetical protein